MAGSRSFAASRSTGHMVVETLVLLVRWYLVIIQLTWFLSLHASRDRISGCKCLMAQPATSSRGDGCSPAYSKGFSMEASLPSSSRRGKGSLGPVSHLLDWKWGCFGGLTHWNSASTLISTCSAQVWLSPAPPVSIGAGVLGWEGPVTGASCIGGSLVGVSCGGAAVVPILGPLGPTPGPSACLYDSSRDSLGFSWGHLGNGAPIKWGHC